MIISTNWLSDYVKHDLAVDDLAEMLTMSGLEVEGVAQVGSALDGVVVGRVLTCESHPNADRLRVCSVDLGEVTPSTIVCGAPNVAAGQLVAVATPGAVLQMPSRESPGETSAVTIRKSKIRGEESHGMICSAAELGRGSNHDGILVLSDDARIGEAFSNWLDRNGERSVDHAIDISITPNRPDAVCHIGIARDVAALTGKPLSMPAVQIPESGGSISDEFSVEVSASDGCQEYVGILVRGVSVSDSPQWLQQRLLTIGLRPRNNIVDITNYVMYELGQPLHAFDFNSLAGSKIVVHNTEHVSNFVTLDGKKRTLAAGTMMIADGERDIAIAGIMGGENSEVTPDTKDVLIESAYFDPGTIRRTAKALQIQTDASYRFERGVDPQGQARAAARAAELMVTLAGGTQVSGLVSVRTESVKQKTVTLRHSRLHLIVGTDIPSEAVVSLLSAIGFDVKEDHEAGTFECTVPTFRPDVEREIDVIEEVARLYGFDKIPEPIRSSIPDHSVEIPAQRRLREAMRDKLAAIGYRELYTNSMLRRETAELFQSAILPGGRFGGELVETLNPISQEMATLRPSLLPGVLAISGYNANHGRKSLRYFEFGNVQRRVQTPDSVVSGYTERESLLVLSSGEDLSSAWNHAARRIEFFDLKGVAESLFHSVGLPDVRFSPAESADPIASSHVVIMSGKHYIGVLGELNPTIQAQYDVPTAVYFMELDCTSLSKLAAPHLRRRYSAFSRYPVVERDLAVTVARNARAQDLLDLIRESGGPLLSDATVFDLYQGDQIAHDMKSIAFSLKFSADRTLRDKEVDKCFDSIVRALESNSGAKLRG